MNTEEEGLALQLQACVTSAAIAMVLYLGLTYFAQYAYEYMGWLALGKREPDPWGDMRGLAFFSVQRSFRYFMGFLLLGVVYVCIDHAHSTSVSAKLALSVLVLPLVLPSVLFFITTREFSGSMAWSVWAILCALYYWGARSSMPPYMHISTLVLLFAYLAYQVSLDFPLWNSRFLEAASEHYEAAQAVDLAKKSALYFGIAESLFVLGQILFNYVLPLQMLRVVVKHGRNGSSN